MIKHLSIALITTAILSGCGGSGDDDFCCDTIPAKSSSSSSAASSAASSEDTTSADLSYGFSENINGWYVNGSAIDVQTTAEIDLQYADAALQMMPLNWANNASANWKYQARMDFTEPTDLTGANIAFTVSIPQSYIDDGEMLLQLIAYGATETDYGTQFRVGDLTANDDGDYVISRDVGTIDLTAAISIGFQLAAAPTDTTINDSILIKSIYIDRPENAGASSSSSSAPASDTAIDFESDDAGATYAGMGYSDPSPLEATVVTIASVSELPKNGDSSKVLRVKVSGWNEMPIFNITLPTGKTLADYKLLVDAYLPRNNLGATAGADNNYYKDFRFFAGASLSGAATQDDNPDTFQEMIGTEGNVDAWHTFEMNVDATKGATLTGAIQISVGVARPAGTSDDYFLDNLRLVELPN